MPHYKEKYEFIITPEDFKKLFNTAKILVYPEHAGLISFLYYTGVRISEALNLTKESFRLINDNIFVDINRLKRSSKTNPLRIPRNKPFAEYIHESVEGTRKNRRVWPYCRKTGYNISTRFLRYPHYFRLNRITNFFLDGFSVVEVQNWTGLTLQALNYYIGLIDINRMGEALK